MFKKLLFGVIITTALFTNTSEVSANTGVSSIKPETTLTKGTKLPEGNWYPSNGRYEFEGQSGFNALYSNFFFTGQTSYYGSVRNHKAYSQGLTFQIYKDGWLSDTRIYSDTIDGQRTESFKVSNLKSSDKIYLKFLAPSHFEGYID